MRCMTGTLRILVASAGACRTVGRQSRGARAVAFLTQKQGDLRGKAEPAPSAVLTSVFGEHHPEKFDVRLGQKRTLEHVQSMSALPPKGDIAESDWAAQSALSTLTILR